MIDDVDLATASLRGVEGWIFGISSIDELLGGTVDGVCEMGSTVEGTKGTPSGGICKEPRELRLLRRLELVVVVDTTCILELRAA